MELFGRKKSGTERLGMDGTYRREKGWNGTFRDGWNFWEGRGVERNYLGWMELMGVKRGWSGTVRDGWIWKGKRVEWTFRDGWNLEGKKGGTELL